MQVRVPDSLYHATGKRKIVRSLGTRILAEAQVLRHQVVGEIKAYLKSLSGSKNNPNLAFIHEMMQHRKAIDLGLHGNREDALAGAALSVDVLRDNYLSPTGIARKGVEIDHERDTRLHVDETQLNQFDLAERIFTSSTEIILISQALTHHLDEAASYIRNQTCNDRKRHVKVFIDWLGQDKEVSHVTRKEAARYLTEKVMKLDLAIPTKKKYIGSLSALFAWCKERCYCDTNPFDGLAQGIKSTTRATRQKTETKRRPFTTSELLSIFNAISQHRGVDNPLWPYAWIALFTGMRSNEIAEIRLIDVYEDYINISEAKNHNSARKVPIHATLKPLVQKLKETSSDDYLISKLGRGGEDNKRNHLIVKRFSSLLRGKAGIKDKAAVYHCFRNTLANALENAGVQLSTAEQIEGHRRQSMTYGLYSHGVELSVLIESINKVKFDKKVEDLLLNT